MHAFFSIERWFDGNKTELAAIVRSTSLAEWQDISVCFHGIPGIIRMVKIGKTYQQKSVSGRLMLPIHGIFLS